MYVVTAVSRGTMVDYCIPSQTPGTKIRRRNTYLMRTNTPRGVLSYTGIILLLLPTPATLLRRLVYRFGIPTSSCPRLPYKWLCVLL